MGRGHLRRFVPRFVAVLAACALSTGCMDALTPDAPVAEPEPAPQIDYYTSTIEPILTEGCTKSRGGRCHVDDGTGRAQGNLDLSTFEAVTRRPDVLRRFGSYPFPLLLMKAAADPPVIDIPVIVAPGTYAPLFIRHAGGAVFDVESPEFKTLETWLDNGATKDGEPPAPVLFTPGCTPHVRQDLFPQTTIDALDTNAPNYVRFVEQVWPVLRGNCLGAQCHGAQDTNQVPTIEFYLTCGDDDRQMRFNYVMSRTYSGRGGPGQLSDKPLRGGSAHAGGKTFRSKDDPRYKAIVEWSAVDPPFPLQQYPGSEFFAANVQPALVARGCYLEACHSLSNFPFYKPLAGTDGLYGTRVSLHNYLQARFMLGLESKDPKQGRLIKKNLMARADGMPHRGGPLLVPLGGCDLDSEAVRRDPTRRWHDDYGAGCILDTWHRLERNFAVEAGQLDPDPGVVGVFVRRPSNPDRLIDFATYRPGADLLRMDLTVTIGGELRAVAVEPRSLLTNCGVDVADADVRRPDIKGDGSEVVFAMRTSADEGLDIWRVSIDGSTCERLGLPIDGGSPGAPVHHFDPIYAPGGVFLFASTMGDPRHPDPVRRAPSVTPKWFLPNANIWVYAEGGRPQRLSYLSGSELVPSLLHTREVIYAVEKAAPDFYQISTRAIRLDDGGGYRPQLGQRTKMGFQQVTEVRELIDFRTAFIGAYAGTHFGGGALGVHDLALGLEEPAFDDSYFHPVEVLDPSAASRPGVRGTGVYRSPTALPDGRILVAYSPRDVDIGDPNAQVDYGLWVVDPNRPEDRWLLYDTPGQFDIEPVVAFERIFVPQPNRAHQGDPKRGEYVFHSLPLFATMMNDNSRLSSLPNNDVVAVRVLEQLSPPAGTTSAEDVAADLHGPQRVYVKRRFVGESPLLADGSLRFMVPASTPLILELLDANGDVIDWQREEEQLGPGETHPRMIHPDQFDGICGGCHNATDGSELGIITGPDILTAASTHSDASVARAVDMYTEPEDRPIVPVR